MLGAACADPERTDLCVEEMLRFDPALQLFERTATCDVTVGGVTVERGRGRGAARRREPRPRGLRRPRRLPLTTRDPNPHLAFGAGLHFCLGALARMELVESVDLLWSQLPGLRLVEDPVPRGTFVLRGPHPGTRRLLTTSRAPPDREEEPWQSGTTPSR